MNLRCELDIALKEEDLSVNFWKTINVKILQHAVCEIYSCRAIVRVKILLEDLKEWDGVAWDLRFTSIGPLSK